MSHVQGNLLCVQLIWYRSEPCKWDFGRRTERPVVKLKYRPIYLAVHPRLDFLAKSALDKTNSYIQEWWAKQNQTTWTLRAIRTRELNDLVKQVSGLSYCNILVGLCWSYISLKYFSHIATWKHGIPILWNRSREIRARTSDPLLRKRRTSPLHHSRSLQ